MNDGDWVESCTALVEHHNGRWEIVTWTREKDDVDINNTGSSLKRLKRRAGSSGTDISGSGVMRTKSTEHDILVKV